MSNIDVLLVTALKEEYDAARDAALQTADGIGVAAWEEGGAADAAAPYLVGTYVGAGGRSMRVALMRSTRMGGTATAPAAAALADRLKPRCLAMCGVCAGNPDAVVLGDVIVAEMTYVYDEGKRGIEAFQGDHRQIPMLDDWVRAAQDLLPDALRSFGEASPDAAERWLLERLMLDEDPRRHPARSRYVPDGKWRDLVVALEGRELVAREGERLVLTPLGRDRVQADRVYNIESPDVLPFAIKVGPIASGNPVAKDPAVWAELKSAGVRSVVGLEMEAATIANIARELRIPNWVVAKGVMDYADPHKDDRYKPFAARASADVLFALLLKQVASAPHAAVAPQEARVKTVYVIGGATGETPYPLLEEPEFQRLCVALGETIARSGAELLVCSPFPDSADLHTAIGYIGARAGGVVQFHSPRHPAVAERRRELALLLGDIRTRLVDYYYPGPENDEAWSQAWLLCQIQALESADAVVAIGGRMSKTASTLLHLADAWGIPVVPFEFFGGAARRAYERYDWERAHPAVDHSVLRSNRGVGEAMRVAGQLALDRMGLGGRRSGAGPPVRFFISRASTDAEFADALTKHLSTAGLTPVLGDHVAYQTRLVQPAIQEALLHSDVCVVLWSGAYARSRWCSDELELALQRQKVGELGVWLFNIDGSDVVPSGARQLPQAVVRTPGALVEAVRELVKRAS